MDTKIKNGDWVRNSSGLLQTVDCFDEILQRIYIRLTVPKGKFIFDKNLGSRLSFVWREKEKLREQRALQLAREALSSMPEVRVISARVDGNANKMVFGISAYENAGEVEVTVGKNV